MKMLKIPTKELTRDGKRGREFGGIRGEMGKGELEMDVATWVDLRVFSVGDPLKKLTSPGRIALRPATAPKFPALYRHANARSLLPLDTHQKF